MRLLKIFLISLIFTITIFTIASSAFASDFSWVKDFDIQAQADPEGFRARLATRFNLDDFQVRTVLSNSDRPADAYIILRLGEMSRIPTGYVVERYRKNKRKGWGSLAKSLGVKPGSKEFHALKRNQDLYDDDNHGQVSVSRDKSRMLSWLTLVMTKKQVSKGKK